MMLSRVADSLYWMSRYLERAEHIARALDVQLNVALDVAQHTASMGWICLLHSLRLEMSAEVISDSRALTEFIAFDRNNPSSIVSCVEAARENSRQIREQIPSEMWEEINRLYLTVREMNMDRLWDAGPHPFFRGVQRGAQLIAGLSDSATNHGEGWEFIRLGRYVERTILMVWMLDAHFGFKGVDSETDAMPEDFVTWASVLRTCMAFEAYCRIHTVELQPKRILDFLLLDAEFPHAIRFCSAEIEQSVAGIANWTGTAHSVLARRLAGRLSSDLAYGTMEEILAENLGGFLNQIVSRCAGIHNAVYDKYIGYTVDAVLQGEVVES